MTRSEKTGKDVPAREAIAALPDELLLIFEEPFRTSEPFAKKKEIGKVNGFLVLGKTENIAPSMLDYFEVVDLRERIYRKR